MLEMLVGKGTTDGILSPEEAGKILAEGLAQVDLKGKRVLVIIPDHSRTLPLGPIFREIYKLIGEETLLLDYLIALGTHPPMPEEHILARVEITKAEWLEQFPKVRFFNHLWKDPHSLVEVGRLPESEVSEITDGRFKMEVPIMANRLLLDYDLLLIVGPVFPHEVVGFSGGNKYLMPGVAGQQIIDFFHWLGAIITNPVIIGNKWTPVRKVVDRAAAFIKTPKLACCLVVKGEELAGMYVGKVEEAWSAAADLSEKLHIVYKDHPFSTVLSCAPKMYDDIWTAGKCMYKLEPVVADGGTLIIYAPHIKEISATHGKILEEIGYHTLDYFLCRWSQFEDYPWGVLAHSTHVRGIGQCLNGVEQPRVKVVLATGIPQEVCERVNLGYLDPATINPQDYANREEEGVLLVPKAGEILYRLKNAPAHLGGKA
jgi:lactate racemase